MVEDKQGVAAMGDAVGSKEVVVVMVAALTEEEAFAEY